MRECDDSPKTLSTRSIGRGLRRVRRLAAVAARLRRLPPRELAAALERLDEAEGSGTSAGSDDVRALVKHFLAELSHRSPGRSVEVRVPPYAAVQAIEGVRHTRGTPPAVVETDAATWIALARGLLAFDEAREGGRLRASGQRSDLSAYLPLT